MADIIYSAIGKNVAHIDAIRKLAQTKKLEFRVDPDGIIIFFATRQQRTKFQLSILCNPTYYKFDHEAAE